MIEKELVVKDEVGLHARPASLFVKLAQEFNGTVTVRFPKINKETEKEEVVEKEDCDLCDVLDLKLLPSMMAPMNLELDMKLKTQDNE